MKHIPRKIKAKYEILEIIGEGAYGVVLKARKRDSNSLVAIKHFKQAPGYSSDVDLIDRELKILQSLRFENVVELIEWFRNKKKCFLVFEYVEWNMLQVLQEHPQGLPLEQVRHLSYQLFHAIRWCHIHEIIHRDIKPENLLISKNFILKLCDFGFARFCNRQISADYYTEYVATRWYRAPELLLGSAYGKPVDIWACGCIMAELKTGQALFAGESDIDQLYRIQKCLGPLPTKYMEAMKRNPKFENIKLSSISKLNTLEQRFKNIFPTDIMNLFKNTLRLMDIDRLTAENCIQHDAFIKFNQKRSQQHRPKTVAGLLNTSQTQIDQNNETIDYTNKRFEENNEISTRHRPPSFNINNFNENSNDMSLGVSTSQQIKYCSSTQLIDRSSSFNRQHQQQKKILRTHSSSSDEKNQPFIYSPRSSHQTSDDENDDDDDDSNSVFLRRKYAKTYQSARSLTQPQPSISPRSKYNSNGNLLKSKQEPTINILQASLKDIDKKLKQFNSDQQQTSETHIYRSLMAVVPSHNTNIHSVQTNNTNNNKTGSSSSFKQQREETVNEFQQRSKSRDINRDLFRSRTIDYHPPVETTSILQRTPSRHIHHQVVPDPMEQVDTDSAVSATCSTSRNPEQQQPQINKFPWKQEPQRSVYGSDSHLMNSKEHHVPFGRSYYIPTKTDNAHIHRIPMTSQRDPSYDSIKTNRLSSRQSTTTTPNTSTNYSKLLNESKKQQTNNNLFGFYPFARTTLLNVATAVIPSTLQRQQSFRFSNTKPRH